MPACSSMPRTCWVTRQSSRRTCKQTAVQDVAIKQAALVIKGEPATHLGQFRGRQLIESAPGNQLDQEDARRVKDTAQQASLEGQLLLRVDIAERAQGEDGAIHLGCPGAAERVRTDPLASLLQCFDRCCGGRAFFLAGFLALVCVPRLSFDTSYLALLPQHVALVLAQAGCADAPQVGDIARPPEVEHGIIADNKGTGDGQQFGGDALERFFELLPG